MKNVSLKKYNTYKLNCTAKEFYIPNDKEELLQILKYIKENNLKYKIIGGGSNIIFAEEVYDGVIIKLDNFNNLEIGDNYITVGSGYNVIKLVNLLANNNIGGLDFASGIPGTVGGMIYNNAGAYGDEIGPHVIEITVINPNLELEIIKEYSYDYRTSFFKENNNYIILEVKLKITPGNKEEILEIIKERKNKRIESQPLNYPSAGSVFRNPEGNFAGKLIEDIGFKGKKIGGAKVSEKHANFIVNENDATGKDIINLIDEIKKEVKIKHNIDLVLEQEIVK